jgi:hypothetical protein
MLLTNLKKDKETLFKETKRKGVSMKKQTLLILLVLLLSLTLSIPAFAQISDEDYDEDETRGTTPIRAPEDEFIEDEVIRLFKYLERVRRGDKNVLKLMTYRTYLAMHDAVLIALGATEKSAVLSDEQIQLVNRHIASGRVQGNFPDYYSFFGNANGLPAFIAGMENQDPKVRLKVIGYLGDWVDEKYTNLDYILSAAEARWNSQVETRDEVRYGLFLLRYKIRRYKILMAIYGGDDRVLKNISAEDFLVLIRGERAIAKLFFPELYTKIVVERSIYVSSIKLDPWKPAPNERAVANSNEITVVGDATKGNLKDVRRLNEYYFKYENKKAMHAIFAGLENRHLLVRENVVQLILDAYFDWAIRLNKYAGIDSTRAAGSRELKADGTGWNGLISRTNVREKFVKEGPLADWAESAYHIRVAKAAWDDVKYSTYSRADDEYTYGDVPNRLLINKNEVDGVNGVAKQIIEINHRSGRDNRSNVDLTNILNVFGIIPNRGDAFDGNRFELEDAPVNPLMPGDIIYENKKNLETDLRFTTTRDNDRLEPMTPNPPGLGLPKRRMVHNQEYIIRDTEGRFFQSSYRIHIAELLRRMGLAWYVGVQAEEEVVQPPQVGPREIYYVRTLFNTETSQANEDRASFARIIRRDLLEGESETGR